MKHTVAVVVLILASLLAPQSRGALPVTATLALPHDNVLPGVPFDLVVTYTNVSNKTVTIGGAGATLVVTFANGEKVAMHKPGGHDLWHIGSIHEPLHLAPGESAQQAASWERGSIPTWFRYGSFSGPGTYAIALELRIVDDDTNLLGTVTTPDVTLHRVDPVGIDAELWNRMQETSGGKWSDNWFKTTEAGNALASEIIGLHPSSGYYPYVLALRAFGEVRDKKSHLPVLLEAAERFPSSPAYPYLLAAAASCARYAGIVAERQGNMADAEKYLTLAKAKYSDALATKASAVIRASSELELRQMAPVAEKVKKKKQQQAH